MDEERMVGEAKAERFITHPQHRRTRQFLGKILY
jgi:ABC-type polar amino acid transport system ATPase subunit